MSPCPWPDNPLRRLPVKVTKGELSVPVNSEAPAPGAPLCAESRIPGRCRLCPYFFEKECCYPHRTAAPFRRGPKLAAWAVGAGESPVAAADAASSELKAGLGGTVPVCVAIVMACGISTTLEGVSEALRIALIGLPDDTCVSLHLELSEARENLVLLCAWAAA